MSSVNWKNGFEALDKDSPIARINRYPVYSFSSHWASMGRTLGGGLTKPVLHFNAGQDNLVITACMLADEGSCRNVIRNSMVGVAIVLLFGILRLF
ncbi:hypothetical protein RRG08_048649 [Elysia crispata]|uniref:Uncharacterized protein n=1 Tax=Elysia crispata TaxID=231223 RepID=A0AAE1ADG2_9GAST|nr:hypothetical protein RRG08_048649 [Elysia crispata]